jgi:hypothetical protein
MLRARPGHVPGPHRGVGRDLHGWHGILLSPSSHHRALGTLAGVRPTLWIAYGGSRAAGWWVFFSPLRRQRQLEDTS